MLNDKAEKNQLFWEKPHSKFILMLNFHLKGNQKCIDINPWYTAREEIPQELCDTLLITYDNILLFACLNSY